MGFGEWVKSPEWWWKVMITMFIIACVVLSAMCVAVLHDRELLTGISTNELGKRFYEKLRIELLSDPALTDAVKKMATS
jgi:hypothetical protein